MVETIFNGGEAILWLAFAAIVSLRYRSSEIGVRRTAHVLASFLVLFAVSDVIEMKTGAWWRPPGLLIFKGACLVGLTGSVVTLFRRLRAR